MTSRGWFALDGRRIFAGPFEEPPPLHLAKTWLLAELKDLDKHVAISEDEVRRRVREVRVEFGVKASRGGFKRLPLSRTSLV